MNRGQRLLKPTGGSAQATFDSISVILASDTRAGIKVTCDPCGSLACFVAWMAFLAEFFYPGRRPENVLDHKVNGRSCC